MCCAGAKPDRDSPFRGSHPACSRSWLQSVVACVRPCGAASRGNSARRGMGFRRGQPCLAVRVRQWLEPSRLSGTLDVARCISLCGGRLRRAHGDGADLSSRLRRARAADLACPTLRASGGVSGDRCWDQWVPLLQRARSGELRIDLHRPTGRLRFRTAGAHRMGTPELGRCGLARAGGNAGFRARLGMGQAHLRARGNGSVPRAGQRHRSRGAWAPGVRMGASASPFAHSSNTFQG